MTNSDKPVLFRPGVGKRGMTELHYAAYCGDQSALERALLAGQDPNAKDQYPGYTAAHWLADAAAVGGPRVQMPKLLVAQGADIHVKAENGASLVSLAKAAGSASGEQLATALISYGATDDADA